MRAPERRAGAKRALVQAEHEPVAGEAHPRMRRVALQSAVGGMAASVAGMMVAAAGLLTPVAGAVVQECIDLAAVLNALRTSLPIGRLSDYEAAEKASGPTEDSTRQTAKTGASV